MSNELSRRGFFKILAGAVVTGTFISSAAVADAIEQFPEDKISIVAARARAIAKDWKLYTAPAASIKNVELAESIKADSATLVDYMNNNFDPKITTQFDVNYAICTHEDNLKMFDMESFDETRLRLFLDGTVPIAILRELFTAHKMRILTMNYGALKESFEIFSKNYSNLIIEARSPSDYARHLAWNEKYLANI